MITPAIPPSRRLARLARGVGALIVLVAIVVGVPMLMIAAGLAPHGLPSLHELKHDLTSRDNGQLAIVAIAIGVWVCWALFTLSLVPELVAIARKRPAYSLPVLGVFQRSAGMLLAAIAIGFAIAPLVTGLGAHRAPAAAPPNAHTHAPVSAASASLGAPTGPAAASAAGHRDSADGRPAHAVASQHSAPLQQYPTYTVRRRDTLWQIAAEHLGDPLRYTEIVALNRDTIGPDNTIWPDTVLRLPQDATGVTGTTGPDAATDGHSTRVVVERGDTLSGIVEHVTGSEDWHPTWAANVGRHEADGHVLTNPNIIWPGDVIDVPTAASATTPSAPPAAPTRAPTHPPEGHRPPEPPAPHLPAGQLPGHGQPTHTQPAHTAPTPASTARQQQPARAGNHQVSAESGSRYVALTLGGGLLAATTLAAIMVLRRRKFRHRRPGHVVASLPPELVPLEQALVAAGRPALSKMMFFDLALRDLAARIEADPDGALPDVVGAAINDTYLELYLTPPSAGVSSTVPPAPWLETAPQRWTLSREAELDPAAGSRLAPYPCLVSVAYAEDGTEFLLDLEHAGAVQLTGDPARCLDLGRYLVAELANNLWSDHLTVTVCGFARELLDANPSRLAYCDDPHTAAIAMARVASDNRAVAADTGGDVLAGRLRGTDGDVWMPHVLLAAPGVPDEDLRLLRESATGHDRAAVAVVLSVSHGADDAAHDEPASGANVHVTADGKMVTGLLPVADLTALGLPETDAPDLARAIALDRDGVLDEPTPPADGDQPCDAFVDAAGALLPEFTLPRAASGPASIDPADPVHSSVLPGPNETYVSSAATTDDDLAQLAPAVTAQTRAAVEQADPDLDELLAAWHDPHERRARLRLLGPVTVTAFGRAPDKQEDLCTEIVAYLWHHPGGVSTDQFANDLWPEQNYTGTDSNPKNMVSRVRHWLDVCPHCGNEYLPRARRDGVQGYRLCCLLCDVDLFRRLRARGEARGADGLPDLVAALELVSGTPLSQLRKFGYGWLSAGDEMLYQGAVSEVAHLVATHALAAGDDGEALHACEVALKFNDEDDYALLQMAKTHERAGRDAEKEATILRLRTLDDPPPRTVEVMRRNGWLSRGA